MTFNRKRVRSALSSFDFRKLFIEELGWDLHRLAPLTISVDGESVQLDAIAEKRGMVAFQCGVTDEGGLVPAYAIRRKIEIQVRKAAHEHLIIYVDQSRSTQIWQWVRREPGRPAASREHTYRVGQSGDALIERLEAISFDLDEEDALSISVVAGRTQRAFDIEKVTKRFYDRFQSEHKAFLRFIQGIQSMGDREWYASLMLNRLMFVYFIQKKGFLDSNTDYLRHRLSKMQDAPKKDQFLTFYRHFLLRLFHEGLGQKGHDSELDALLGAVPYLNGGLFEVHKLERDNREIEIPDQAFERIFDFFDAYQWHLDSRPLHNDNEINPDVLGYIFEKYINQKQMGAYYTKEDVTAYISGNTVLPFLFEAAREKCEIAFENPKGPTVWDLLAADPDRYIYESVRHGIDLPLPEAIEAGIAPPSLDEPVGKSPVRTLELRKEWDKHAPDEFGLPTEIWREVVARRKHYERVRQTVTAGDVASIEDLVTLNLDARQFAQDVVENCEGPEFLRAFWRSIENVRVLDPTCGSGAFLFAALNILEPLYEACLERMEAFLDDSERLSENGRGDQFPDFREILARVASHTNRRYFIFKSIILNNLFGVDIMEEAVEICKLRLFLKLASEVEPDLNHANLGIDPLPDIDFNIKAGNSLVGFATFEEAKTAIMSKFDFDSTMEKLVARAAELQEAFDAFRGRQVEGDGTEPIQHKLDLRDRLTGLQDELNRYFAVEHGVDPTKKEAYSKWLQSHQPFHWFVEFFGIMNEGGFDVVIGNPPYVEYSEKSTAYQISKETFSTYESRNLYTFVFERAKVLSTSGGRVGFIVQISSVSTPAMKTMAAEIKRNTTTTWLSNYATRPSCLFDGVTMNLTIIISHVTKLASVADPTLYSTNYQRWTPDYRPFLFDNVRLVRVDLNKLLFNFAIPKLTDSIEDGLLGRLLSEPFTLAHFLEPSKRTTGQEIFYRTAGGRYYKIFVDRPFGSESKSNKSKSFGSAYDRHVMIAVLSSDIWWWYYTLHFDMYNCKDYMMFGFPFDYKRSRTIAELQRLGEELSADLFSNADEKMQTYASTGKRQQLIFKPSSSRPIIESIDRLLAAHYNLSEEELDFILNYDIKYRLGAESEEKVGEG